MPHTPKKILISPCAYKGTFSPLELCGAIANGIKEVLPNSQCKFFPLADGGDGTIEALSYLLKGEKIETEVLGPTGEAVSCSWLLINKTRTDQSFAVVELASASGIAHLEGKELSPLDSHTRGCGQVLKECIEAGIKNICLTVGGSASTDGGTGILYELGARFYDSRTVELPPAGRSLELIASLDLTELLTNLDDISLTVLCDVNNPLFGKEGAAHVYGPQKGASRQDVERLDRGLRNYARVLEQVTGVDRSGLAGAGAAGGVPFAMVSVLKNVTMVNGFDWFAKATDLKNAVNECDLVVGAEGHLDSQSVQGKAIGELAKMCRSRGNPLPLWIIPARASANLGWRDFGITDVQESATLNMDTERHTATLEDVGKAATLLCSKHYPG